MAGPLRVQQAFHKAVAIVATCCKLFQLRNSFCYFELSSPIFNYLLLFKQYAYGELLCRVLRMRVLQKEVRFWPLIDHLRF